MTKTELKKLKELDTFLRERNMQFRGTNIIFRFNADKINCVQLDLDMNWEVGYSNIKELNKTPTIKNEYYIQYGKIKQY